jgi:hypothetical protein
MFKMSKYTNLDIKDAAYLHIVHNLQHPTSRQTTNSTQSTMDDALKRTCRYFQQDYTANRQSRQPNNVINRMKATVTWRQTESEPLGHCAA